MYIKRQMKKAILPVIMLLLSMLILSGCRRSDSLYYDEYDIWQNVRWDTHSFFYDADELMQDLVRTEIIYIEFPLVFSFLLGMSPERIVYDVVRELTPEETDSLLRGLSNMEFIYNTVAWEPQGPLIAITRAVRLHGYVIRLTYDPNITFECDREPFILVAQASDFRFRMPRLMQDRAVRQATDDDWEFLMSEFIS